MLTAIQLTDESGRWFDSGLSTRIAERTWFDGNNHISANTGSQWSHEALWHTRKGTWILEESSGHSDHYKIIDEEEAVRWISHNDAISDEQISNLPADTQARLREQFKGFEI